MLKQTILKNQDNHQMTDQHTNNLKSKLTFMKNVCGLSSLLNNSSNYWEKAIQNTLYICNREDITKSELENENKNIKNDNNNLFKVTNINQKKNNCNKNIYTKEWSNQENEILIKQYFKLGNKNIKKLSELIKTKSIQQINYRIKKIESKSKMRSFTRQDDLKIIELLEIYGKNWDLIEKNFTDFTSEMLEERYYNKLDPKLKRTKFTEEEDEKIITLYLKYGNKWKEISCYFPDRNANMIKNRFYSFLKKKNNINGFTLNDKNTSFIESSSINTSSNNELLTTNSTDNLKLNNSINSEEIKDDFLMDINQNSNYNDEIAFRIEKILSLNDDIYSSQNGIILKRVNSGGNNNKDINNPNFFDTFKETYQKIFSSNSFTDLNNGYDDDNFLLEKEQNEEKENLFNEFKKLEEIVKKIDSYEEKEINVNNNYIKENKLSNELLQKKDNLNHYQKYLKNKLQKLKENCNNNFNNSDEELKSLLEINDNLLKLISVSKLKIIINKKLTEIENEEDISME